MAACTIVEAIRADLGRDRRALLDELERERDRPPLPPLPTRRVPDPEAAARARLLTAEVAAFYEQRKTERA